jgi:hypothetical protein
MATVINDEVVLLWRKNLARLKEEEAERRSQIAELERKLQAAAVLGFQDDGMVISTTSKTTFTLAEDAEVERDYEAGDEAALPSLIIDVLTAVGHSMRPTEIKRALLERGVQETRFGSNSSYYYTALRRLAKRGRIIKKGTKYRIPNAT